MTGKAFVDANILTMLAILMPARSGNEPSIA
jgi:hypothetical protein